MYLGLMHFEKIYCQFFILRFFPNHSFNKAIRSTDLIKCAISPYTAHSWN